MTGTGYPDPVDFPLQQVVLRLADAEPGATLRQGAIGIFEVKGPNVSTGYRRMPEKAASEFQSVSLLVTGYLGKIDERDYVHIVGRGKDLIITGV